MKVYVFFVFLFVFVSATWAQDSSCMDGDVKIGSVSYDSIQSAVSSARDGDTISIGSGVFSENVDIRGKNNLTLISECFPEIQKIRVREGSGILLKGLSIRTPDNVRGSALRLMGMQNTRVENTHVFNSANKGIEVDRNSTGILFSNVSVYNNEEGFFLEDGVGVVIQGSRVYGNRGNGIFIRNVSSVLIEDTEVYNNQRYGIVTYHATGSSHQTEGFIGLRRLRVYANGNAGISLRSHHGWRVSSSEITMNLGDGLHINKSAFLSLHGKDVLDSNNISRNGRYGIFLKSSQELELINNEIVDHENGYGIFYEVVGTGNNVFLKENIITNNSGSAVLLNFHSKDLYSYNLYLDNEDTGNQTTLNDEGLLGVGNYRPQAVAGDDILFSMGDKVRLSAKDSYDWDGDALSYTWMLISQPEGSMVSLEDANSTMASFSPDMMGEYEIELIVNDGRQVSSDRIKVSSSNVSPVSKAGSDQLISLGDTVTLNGSLSSDANTADELSYQWSFLRKPVGSSAEITDSGSIRASFIADKPGDYKISLRVSDEVLSSIDNVTVSTENIPPVVEIIPPSSPSLSTLSLSATVTDEERDISYRWSVLSGPLGVNTFEFSNRNTKETSFTPLQMGLYVLQLRADDGEKSSQDTLFLNITNQPPTANAGADISNAVTKNRVSMSGSGSSDPEGGGLTYKWNFSSKPTGSFSVIGDSQKAEAFFLPDKPGVYILSLKVSDGFLESLPDTLMVTVADPQNTAPVLGSIGNKSVNIGNELKFRLTGTDADTSDSLRFMASPLTLFENMTLNSQTGDFFFKPRAHQAGTYNLTFRVIDESGASDSEDIVITVNALVEDATTSVRGRVLDATSMTSDRSEVPLVGAGIRVSVDGNNMYRATTDSQGNFTINNLPSGAENIIQIRTTGVTGPNNSKYGDFNEQIEVIQGVSNMIHRPFYMPRIDSAGTAMVNSGQATMVRNTNINVEMNVPADTAMMNDVAFTGEISISQVPKALAPVALPESLEGTAMLITIQPAGLRFTSPVPITFPNIDNFVAGTEVDIFSVNPDTGLFEVSGRGRVTADGTKIETISGGVSAATWHTPMPPGPEDDCEGEECDEDPDDDCETCKVGSSVDLMTGQLREEHTLASYRSLNQQRLLTLSYNSQLADSLKTVSARNFFPVITGIPGTVSIEIRLSGLSKGREVFTNTSSLPEDEEKPFRLWDTIDLSSLPTGLHTVELITKSHYTQSTFARIVKHRISLLNYRDSPYGVGWNVSNLQRIYPSDASDLLLVSGNGFKSHFRVSQSENNGARVTYTSPSGDYSTLQKVSNGGYVRKMKDGMVYNFNSSGFLLSEEDRNGNKTTYCYDAANRLKCIKDPNGMEYTFSYKGDNRLDQITDPQGRVTRFEHNSTGHLIRITDPDNSTREFSYNNQSLMVAQKDKRGNLTNYIYDKNSQVTQTIRSEGTGVSLSSQSSSGLTSGKDEGTQSRPLPLVESGSEEGTYTDFNGHTNRFTLNDRGQFIEQTDALGRVTRTSRNRDGERTRLVTPRGFVWTYSYDAMGNQTVMRQEESDTETSYTYESTFNQLTSIKKPNGDITRFEYDTKGNLLKLIRPDRTFHEFEYNKAGLTTKVKDPMGFETRYFYDRLSGNLIAYRDSLGHTSHFELDNVGNVIQIKDPNGHTVRNEYDSLNRLTKSYDAENGESVYTYDPNSNLMSLRDPKGQITTYTYDVLNRLIQRTNPLDQSEYFTYDNEDYLTSWMNRKGIEVKYVYDSSNQLIEKHLGDNIYRYNYDKDGNQTSLSNNDSKISYDYDSLDRVVSSSLEGSIKQPAIVLHYTYDGNGNRTGLRASYAGEDHNYIENLYTYDEENQLTSLSSLIGSFHFKYDNLSRLVEMTYPNEIRTTLSYEGDSRLSEIRHKRGFRTQSLFSYSYDKFNNRIRMKTFRGILPVNDSLSYTYDKKNQLLTATNPLNGLPNQSFTYDSAGNRLRKEGQTEDSVYNSNNQLTNDPTHTYLYDDDGNLVQKTHKRTKATTRYEWDIENRLIRVTKHETENALPGETITYTYDTLNRRIEKNVNGEIKRYVYDNENILFEFDGDNFLKKFYIHGPGIDNPLAMVEGDLESQNPEDIETHYYHKDGLGSVISLTDHQGKERERYVYDSFGRITIYDDGGNEITPNSDKYLENPFTYTGREYDAETGLYFYRARYYNPQTGTFLSEDPLGFGGGDENLYRYVGNNPLNYIDPGGKNSLRVAKLCKARRKIKILKKGLNKCGKELNSTIERIKSFADEAFRLMGKSGTPVEVLLALNKENYTLVLNIIDKFLRAEINAEAGICSNN